MPLSLAASIVWMLMSALLRRMVAWLEEMKPMPPMSAASA
jgi:hypothetical protein